MDWASRVLFAAHLGSPTEKRALASTLTGLTLQTIKEMSRANVGTMPCVYLFSLGTVDVLRENMELDDCYCGTDSVYKWGYTNELARRAGEHDRDYRKLGATNMRLVYHCYVDVKYVAEAEGSIRSFFGELEMGIKYGTSLELVIIPKKKLPFVRDQYLMIGKNYMGRVQELIAEKREMEHLHQLKISEMAHAITQKELENKDLRLQLLQEKYDNK
jgi:hypothetical protein